MKYRIIQTELITKQETVMFSTNDFELAEMMFKDYIKQSSDHHSYELIEKLSGE